MLVKVRFNIKVTLSSLQKEKDPDNYIHLIGGKKREIYSRKTVKLCKKEINVNALRLQILQCSLACLHKKGIQNYTVSPQNVHLF